MPPGPAGSRSAPGDASLHRGAPAGVHDAWSELSGCDRWAKAFEVPYGDADRHLSVVAEAMGL